MAVNVPNSGIFFQQVSAEIVALRDAFQALVNSNDYIAAMGGVNFLETVMGLSAGDAQALIAALGNHAALAVQYGGGAQAPVLNYRANGQPFWGGQ